MTLEVEVGLYLVEVSPSLILILLGVATIRTPECIQVVLSLLELLQASRHQRDILAVDV